MVCILFLLNSIDVGFQETGGGWQVFTLSSQLIPHKIQCSLFCFSWRHGLSPTETRTLQYHLLHTFFHSVAMRFS